MPATKIRGGEAAMAKVLEMERDVVGPRARKDGVVFTSWLARDISKEFKSQDEHET